MALWTSSEAAAATRGRSTADWVAHGVSIDTRTIQPGDLFVALSAARDGHDFVAQALEKGASAALVSRIPEGLTEAAPLLIVADVQTALEALGRAARARSAAKVVGVTGSVGKTSTKEMLRAVLSGQGRTHAAEASYNNHWGVPLTLARMPVGTEFAVIEIGMNHPGEIAPLARIARPDVAMITTVAAAHLEVGGDDSDRTRVNDAFVQGLGGKAAKHHAVGGANTGAGLHGNHAFERHGHVHQHAVALLHAQCLQTGGHALHFGVQLTVGVGFFRVGFGRHKDQGGLVGPLGQVAVHRVVAQIGGSTDKPLGKWGMAVIANLLRRYLPVNQLRLLCPKRFGIGDGAVMELRIACHDGLRSVQ